MKWNKQRVRRQFELREMVMMSSRERVITGAFVELADTLVADYDVLDLLTRLTDHCVDSLDASAAGLMLTDQRGRLQLLASSNEQTRLLELFQLQNDEGPCLECFRTGQPVTAVDLLNEHRWPRLVPQVLHAGFATVHALPMRLRANTIGALNLFRTQPTPLNDEDLRLGQAWADVATIGILQARAISRGDTLVEQLQGALNSRVLVEQAKGLLADRGKLDMDTAFNRLRGYARAHNRPLKEVATEVIEDRSRIATVLAGDEKRQRSSES
jgi:GAF domain-containing protein